MDFLISFVFVFFCCCLALQKTVTNRDIIFPDPAKTIRVFCGFVQRQGGPSLAELISKSCLLPFLEGAEKNVPLVVIFSDDVTSRFSFLAGEGREM